MSLRHRGVKYETLSQDDVDGQEEHLLEEGDDDFTDKQFYQPERKIALMTIGFILCLFTMGIVSAYCISMN